MMLGINQSNLAQLSPADMDMVCGQIANYGAKAVRFSADWALASNFLGFGPPDYSKLKTVHTALMAHGLTPLPILGCHAPWNHSPKAFGDFTKGVVDIFGCIPAYEVWNEPNLCNFSVGNPATFLGYLRAAAPVIRAAGSKVIHGGLAAYPDHQFLWLRNYSPATWLEGLHAAGESNDYDMLGYHPYPLSASGEWSDPSTNPFGMQQITALDSVRHKYSDTRPYTFTEIGYDTNAVPNPSAWLFTQIETLTTHPNVDNMWMFCWRDTAGDGGNFGVVDANNQPKKPYYNVVQGLMR